MRRKSVIVKLPTLDPGGRNVGMMMGVWEREARFYEEVAPLLGVRVPQVHVNRAEGGDYVLVMEDLAPFAPRGPGARCHTTPGASSDR